MSFNSTWVDSTDPHVTLEVLFEEFEILTETKAYVSKQIQALGDHQLKIRIDYQDVLRQKILSSGTKVQLGLFLFFILCLKRC